MNGQLVQEYRQYIHKKYLLGLILGALIFIMAILAINAGSANLSFKDTLMTLLGQGTKMTTAVVWRIRMPRIIAAIVAGAGLSVAGCVLQNNLRNPLASPSTLGVSSAAAFGANFAIIILGAGAVKSTAADAVSINNPYVVTLCAFAGSMIATLVILALAKLKDFTPEAVVLAGVALSSLFSAGTTLMQYFAQDAQVAAAVFWTFGDLGRVSWKEVHILSAMTLMALIFFMFRRWDYNALDSGEETAKSLGVNVEKFRFESMLVSSMITSVSVAFLGVIGFVGLIAPQIVRRLIGNDQRYLLPLSTLMGALILLIADTLARTLISPVILPVGAITSFFGAPLFLYMLMRGHKKR